MTIKAHPRANGGKQHQQYKIILSNYKNHSKSFIFRVVCEGCGWTAQFHTGKEAGEAGWKHHSEIHHAAKLSNSHKTECPVTRIFGAMAGGRGPFPLVLKNEMSKGTSNALQGAEK